MDFKRIAFLAFFVALSAVVVGCTSASPEIIENKNLPIDTKTQKPLTIGLQVGEIAPPYGVTATKGMIVDNGSFNGPVLLYFFATWCPYCKEDFESLSTIYPSYENDVSILAIDMDLKENAALIDEYASTFHNLDSVWFATGNRETLSSYQIKYTTTKYAIAKNGTVLYAGSGAFTKTQWLTLLDAMRNTNTPSEDDQQDMHNELITS